MYSIKSTILGLLLVSFATLTAGGLAQAQPKSGSTKTKQGATMNAELKRDMAEMYKKMGECMKTEKSMEQCQKDIMKDCPVMKKSGHCPLMEGMKPMQMDHSEHQ